MNISKSKKWWGLILLLLAVIAILALYPLPPPAPIQYYDRQTGSLKTEKVAGEKWLVWLYNNPVGEATLWALAKRKVVSSVYGNSMDRPSSTKKIQPFVEEFGIDMSTAQRQEFNSFNDFFTRKLKNNARPVDTNSSVAVSPADGKILAYANIRNSDFIIKGYRFNVLSFLNNARLAQKYLDGTLVIIRLAPFDYHRFHFPVSGSVSPVARIEGDYYSVNPLALRKMTEIFCLNKREFAIISNPMFGDVVMCEVGATMVGSIVQTYAGNLAKKGEEKGYFKFGGSTVVLLFEKNKIRIDDDLLNHTLKGYETVIKEGERIGVSMNNLTVSR
jgi:phosphatidylserine decarboxylase